MTEPDWRQANRANWDERVGIHLAAETFYDLAPLRAGRARFSPIEEAELGSVAGLRLLHLQCHFGKDTLTLAQRGATVTGLDFSGPAIAAARSLAAELRLDARFVESDLYDAPTAIPEPASFDRVFVTWGTIGWLPDIKRWAEIVAGFLKPGGALYFAEGHPAALVFDDRAPPADGKPGYAFPYFERGPIALDDEHDYADDAARIRSTRTYEWMHGLGEVVSALTAAGLRLRWLHEHDRLVWRMFRQLERDADGMYRWPDRPWLPLAYSLWADKPQ